MGDGRLQTADAWCPGCRTVHSVGFYDGPYEDLPIEICEPCTITGLMISDLSGNLVRAETRVIKTKAAIEGERELELARRVADDRASEGKER